MNEPKAKPEAAPKAEKIKCVANTTFYDARGRTIDKGKPYVWDTADGPLPKCLTEVPEAPKAQAKKD